MSVESHDYDRYMGYTGECPEPDEVTDADGVCVACGKAGEDCQCGVCRYCFEDKVDCICADRVREREWAPTADDDGDEAYDRMIDERCEDEARAYMEAR